MDAPPPFPPIRGPARPSRGLNRRSETLGVPKETPRSGAGQTTSAFFLEEEHAISH